MNCVQKNRLACLIILAASFFPFFQGTSGQFSLFNVARMGLKQSTAMAQSSDIALDLCASNAIILVMGVVLLLFTCIVMNLRPFPFLIAIGMAFLMYQVWLTVTHAQESSILLASLVGEVGLGLGFWGIALGLSMLILPIQTRPVTSRPIPVQVADPHSYRGSF